MSEGIRYIFRKNGVREVERRQPPQVESERGYQQGAKYPFHSF